jgi:hypothetical protein
MADLFDDYLRNKTSVETDDALCWLCFLQSLSIRLAQVLSSGGFIAAVLTNGRGFYDALVYVLECHRLGLKLMPPDVNEPRPAFLPHGN